MIARGKEVGRVDREFGISRCYSYIQRINNNFLLYSTGKYIQYPVIHHNGKEYKKIIYIYMYVCMDGCESWIIKKAEC